MAYLTTQSLQQWAQATVVLMDLTFFVLKWGYKLLDTGPMILEMSLFQVKLMGISVMVEYVLNHERCIARL